MVDLYHIHGNSLDSNYTWGDMPEFSITDPEINAENKEIYQNTQYHPHGFQTTDKCSVTKDFTNDDGTHSSGAAHVSRIHGDVTRGTNRGGDITRTYLGLTGFSRDENIQNLASGADPYGIVLGVEDGCDQAAHLITQPEMVLTPPTTPKDTPTTDSSETTTTDSSDTTEPTTSKNTPTTDNSDTTEPITSKDTPPSTSTHKDVSTSDTTTVNSPEYTDSAGTPRVHTVSPQSSTGFTPRERITVNTDRDGDYPTVDTGGSVHTSIFAKIKALFM